MYLLEKMKKVLAILTMLVLAVAMPLTASASGDSSEEFDPKEVIFTTSVRVTVGKCLFHIRTAYRCR